MSYRKEYYKLVERLKEIAIDFYGDKLISSEEDAIKAIEGAKRVVDAASRVIKLQN